MTAAITAATAAAGAAIAARAALSPPAEAIALVIHVIAELMYPMNVPMADITLPITIRTGPSAATNAPTLIMVSCTFGFNVLHQSENAFSLTLNSLMIGITDSPITLPTSAPASSSSFIAVLNLSVLSMVES